MSTWMAVGCGGIALKGAYESRQDLASALRVRSGGVNVLDTGGGGSMSQAVLTGQVYAGQEQPSAYVCAYLSHSYRGTQGDFRTRPLWVGEGSFEAATWWQP